MSLWQFLQWLFTQIGKVLDWFGSAYEGLRQGAANAWSWAVSLATQAYNNAVAWALTNIAIAKVLVIAYAASLYYKALQALSSADTAIRAFIATVRAELAGAITGAITIAVSLYNTVRTWAQGVIDAAKTSLTEYIQALIKLVTDLFSPLLPLKDVKDKLLQLTALGLFGNLVKLGTAYFGLLTALVTKPLSFIFSLMWGEFINFLCYVLGYGLGTVNATLPNLPTWGSGTGVIVDPGDGDIPPGSGVLTHPVEPLSVSGYTFNSSHKGVDWGISLRQSVYAAHDGVIDAAGWSEAGYGYKIDISGGSYWSRYAHLDQILVSVGQSVRAGDLIAYGNSTGNSTGNHLHFELRINGVYVNPVLYM